MIDISHFRPGVLVPHVSDSSADQKGVFESPSRFEYLYVDETMFFH